MTTTKGAEMSVTVNNSPIQDYSSCIFTLQAIMLHLLIKIMTPGFKHFTVLYPTAIPNHWSVVLLLSVNGHLSHYHLALLIS